MKLSRRELAATAIGAVVAPSAAAQTPPASPSSAGAEDLARTIHDANRRNSETLAKLEIPIATEPAFQFKA